MTIDRMSKLWLTLLVVSLSGCGGKRIETEAPGQMVDFNNHKVEQMALELTSPKFEDEGRIPVDYTCDGGGVSPPLVISGIPDEAVELVLLVDDPDAPSGDFVHWMVWKINPEVTEVAEGLVPRGGFEGMNDFEKAEYGGPCPPTGVHRYMFRLYAVDEELELEEDASREDLEKAMAGHIVDETVLTGRYSR